MINWCKRHKSIIVLIAGLIIIILGLCWKHELVKQNDGLVMAIVTTILIATTMYYSWLNRCLLETTDMPKVVVYIRPWKKYAEQHVLIIENLGTGTAFNIRFDKVDTSFILQKNPELYLADIPCIKEGIDYMPPKQDYKTFIESTGLTDGQRNRSYEIKVDYTNSQGKKFTDSFNLNIGVNLHYFHEYPVVEHLEEIAIHAKQIASHTKQIANQPSNTQSTSRADLNLQSQLSDSQSTSRADLNLRDLSASDISKLKEALKLLSSLDKK